MFSFTRMTVPTQTVVTFRSRNSYSSALTRQTLPPMKSATFWTTLNDVFKNTGVMPLAISRTRGWL